MNSGSSARCSARWRADSRYIAKSPTGRVGTRNTHATRTPMARATMRSPTLGGILEGLRATGYGLRRFPSRQRAARNRAAIDRVAAEVVVVAPEDALATAHALALGRDGDPFLVGVGERRGPVEEILRRQAARREAQHRGGVRAGVVAMRPQVALIAIELEPHHADHAA